MTEPQRYPAHVFYSEEDEGFIAIEAWQIAARKAGNPVPALSKPAAVARTV